MLADLKLRARILFFKDWRGRVFVFTVFDLQIREPDPSLCLTDPFFGLSIWAYFLGLVTFFFSLLFRRQ